MRNMLMKYIPSLLLLIVSPQAAGQSDAVSELYQQAVELTEAGDLWGVIEVLDSIAELDPDYAPVYIDRGMIYRDLGELRMTFPQLSP